MLHSKNAKSSEFFYEEIDVTKYFIEQFPKKLKELKHPEYISIELTNSNYNGITNVYFCIHKHKIQLAGVISISCIFSIETISNEKKSISLITNEYETEEKDIKCSDLILKELFINCFKELKDEILNIYLNETERFKLFNTEKNNNQNIKRKLIKNSNYKNKFTLKYKLNFNKNQFLEFIFNPQFINCYEKIIKKSDFEIELEKYKIITKELSFNQILSKKYKFNSESPLIFNIEFNKEEVYEVCFIFEDNLFIINIFTNNNNIKFVENNCVIKPCNIFKQNIEKCI